MVDPVRHVVDEVDQRVCVSLEILQPLQPRLVLVVVLHLVNDLLGRVAQGSEALPGVQGHRNGALHVVADGPDVVPQIVDRSAREHVAEEHRKLLKKRRPLVHVLEAVDLHLKARRLRDGPFRRLVKSARRRPQDPGTGPLPTSLGLERAADLNGALHDRGRLVDKGLGFELQLQVTHGLRRADGRLHLSKGGCRASTEAAGGHGDA